MLSLIPYGVTAGTRESARRIVRDAAEAGHPVTHVWGYSSSRFSDHRNRRCVDFMVASIDDGQWIADYLTRYVPQLRIRYIIWNRRQWRDYPKRGVKRQRTWVRYWRRNKHRDHLHVEFDA